MVEDLHDIWGAILSHAALLECSELLEELS
jgi:hypothetical protein